MLNKGLFKVLLVLTLGVSFTACQSETPTTTNEKIIEISADNDDYNQPKKISSDKWLDFQKGFKRKATVSDVVHTARSESQKEDIMREYGNENPKRKVTMADRINLKKWEEFQTAFKNRAAYYINNISNALN